MKPKHTFVVNANLPHQIETLKELAYNYWWCWNSDARELFIRIDRDLWEEVNHNPVLLLNKLPQSKLLQLAQQADFTSYLHYIHGKFLHYINSHSWFKKSYEHVKGQIAYFSPEYGINESFPIYSGGLGILSGDHLKSASDLGIPLVGVGLLYQQGYFRQHLQQNGWQTEMYLYNDFYSMPLVLIRHENGEPIILDVDLPEGKAYFQIWKLNVGRINLFLLDTNIDLNSRDEYRDITDQLYGGTRETRIQQEIILGIGGMRALKVMGIDPEVIHINEGHAAFALLERIRFYMEKYGTDFHTTKQIVKNTSVFTTHTPVPAGNEMFKLDLFEKYFNNYYQQLGLSKKDFIELGQVESSNVHDEFSMTVLGIKLTAYENGVSKLHGSVSRKMWKDIWKCFPEDEIPIKHITNGVHTQTWVAREFSELYDRYLSPVWRTDTDNPEIWDKISIIPNEEIWREKQRRRVRLVLFIREYLKKRQKEFLLPEQVSKISGFLDPDALTIGFARRFATYKRALLIFSDMERLKRILLNSEKPVQIIIAGKAHPHDVQGKEVIQTIIRRIREYGLEGHVVFLEDYDMVISRMMVKGCDVWLNNPIRPLEASGTSGMKAAINGTLNLSILDGWWDEAFNAKNGFAIGEGEEYNNQDHQNIIESNSLYDLLEQVVVPMFYNRLSRIPQSWVNFMKESIRTIAGEYSTHRMVKNYAEMFYIPSLKNFQKLTSNGADGSIQLRLWEDKVKQFWSSVEIIDISIKDNINTYLGKPIHVSTIVALGQLKPEDVTVQVYYGSVNPHNEMIDVNYETLGLIKSEANYHYYEGYYNCPGTGVQGFTIRILPRHDMMVNSADLYLCAWANQ
ncbi:MAG: alpha-glucan family phosphorylase [Candidatus Kapabacteria bacterium]|nr:alpha-glucan family phosphorylase [Candidatus Kapabacteria bacterium]